VSAIVVLPVALLFGLFAVISYAVFRLRKEMREEHEANMRYIREDYPGAPQPPPNEKYRKGV
jgi:hypothetical protein